MREAAERRRQHRRDQDRGRGRRERARRLRRAEVIEDRRAHDRHRGAAAERLHDARGHQQVERVGATMPARLPAMNSPSEAARPAGARTVGERRDREVAEAIARIDRLIRSCAAAGRHAHRVGDGGQGGQQHVQPEGADRADDRGAGDQPAGSVACLQAGIRSLPASCGLVRRPQPVRGADARANC